MTACGSSELGRVKLRVHTKLEVKDTLAFTLFGYAEVEPKQNILCIATVSAFLIL